ncbi:superoxide dismutase [Colletotrichum scovillei]|uniref:superoxide dismutase n=1 Tax=Colletotrichum scovillei TaxID=1209932 RepID=A0A9P7UA26_9PEZI|nr:superoxide dismutase [Colletotrichum scovillei]KAF4774960.1 superoxide dismutase [Colletotrichum scovillei]KAG7043025.1 superoxide dismutase [Colletotrichum scovillei]KAG7043614.1 superoxide dismutase [Colletotrichum scovillei]KAG7063068.1 superoxide dismutase [Colletotrichum scovillei]
MKSFSIVSIIAAAAVGRVASQSTGELGDATIVSNPAGVVYEAVLPEKPFYKAGSLEGNVQGSIVAVTAPDGKGVEFKVRFSNLPKEGGPFTYHLHVDPVPEDGNCTKTLAHLDPFIRGEATKCDSSKPETCQVGDLSGKHGAVAVDYEKTYVDPYLSIVEGPGSFFGNRSFVFHFANKTRISCANFKLITKPDSHDNCSTTTAATMSGTGAAPTATSSPTSSIVPFPGAASTSGASISLMIAGFAAVLFVL